MCIDSDNIQKKLLETTDLYNPELVSQFLNGSASEAYLMIKLMSQVFAILITGLILWRISVLFSKRKINRRKSIFTESRFQQHWKK